MENEITVLFVSYHSDDIIEKSIMTIDKNIKIIVVENSKNNILKNKLEEKYSNVKVIIPQENAGDLKEVPKNITQDLNIKPVSWIDEVLQIALESKTKPLSEADFMGENAKKSHSGEDNRPSTH